MVRSSRRAIGRRQKEILTEVYGLVSEIALDALLSLITNIVTDSRQNKYAIKKTLNNLVDKGYLILGGDKVKITAKGRKAVMEYSNIIFNRDDDWDGSWRLISYDIPVSLSAERNSFRVKLKESGFKKLHDSLWVYPYDCREQVAIYCVSHRISTFVVFMEALQIPREKIFLRTFGLTKPNKI